MFCDSDWTRRVLNFQYIAMLTVTLNVMSSGMHYGWASPSLPILLSSDSPIPITSDQGSWVAVMISFGTVCGSILGGLILDRIGRKNAILLTSVPFFTAWMLLAFAKTVSELYIGRFIAGISDGLIFCAIPMYLGEIADPKIRGFLGSSVSATWPFGVLLINIIGSYCSIYTTALICSTLPILLLLTFSWMPESPYYLIMKGNFDQARKSLQVFKGTEDVEQELTRLSKALEEQNQNSGSFFRAFTVKSNRRALYIMMGSRAAQQLSGITAIMFYAQIIFKEAGDSISYSTCSIIYFGMQLLLSGICSVIVDKTGRKPLMIVSIIGSGLVLLTEGTFFYIQTETDIDTTAFELVPIVALILFVIAFSIGMQTIPVLMLGELFATDVKAIALSFADIYLAVLMAVTSKFFQITKDAFGMYVPFFAFTVCCILGLLFIIFCVPETKGKTLEEIQLELKGEHKEKSVEMSEITKC